VDTRPDTMKNIASYFGINAQKLQRHYKHQVSGYHQWDQLDHAQEYLIYPDNITSHLSIDELSLSKGELYTFVTNKNTGIKNKKSIVAIINGTQSKVIEEVLKKISLEKRSIVKEVTMDMARNMASAVDLCFPLSTKVIDRFHAVKLVMDAMQHVRISLRWQAIDDENKAVKEAKDQKRKYKPEILSNGDTIKELLARSRYLLYTLEENWTANQAKRATILFEKYPTLQTAYKLTLMFRGFYKSVNKEQALKQFIEWKTKVIEAEIPQFNTVVHSLEYHLENILNFFDNRNTNANAESFNSKIKGFRANLRGVSDVQFFLFRLQKLFA
jgi:transposase